MKYQTRKNSYADLSFTQHDHAVFTKELTQSYNENMDYLKSQLFPRESRKEKWRAGKKGKVQIWLGKADKRFAVPSIVLICCCIALSLFQIAQCPIFHENHNVVYPVRPFTETKQEIPAPQPQAVAIHINQADVFALSKLPGIGSTYAQRIIDEREANGPFHYPEDLLSVRGIGEKRLSAIRDLLIFN